MTMIETSNVTPEWLGPVIAAIRRDPGAEAFFAGIHSAGDVADLALALSTGQAFMVAAAVDGTLAAAFIGDIQRASGIVLVHQIVFKQFHRHSVRIAKESIGYFTREIWPDFHSLIAIVPDTREMRPSRMVAAACGFRRVGTFWTSISSGKPSEAIIYQYLNAETERNP